MVINKSLAYLLLMPFFLFTCCKKKEKGYLVSKIEIASDGAMAPSNGRVLAFDSALNCSFYGAKRFKKPGFFKGAISQQFWDTANEKLANTDYKTASSSDNVGTPDVEYLEIIIYYGSNKKHLVRCNFGKQSALVKAAKWIIENYDKAQLHMVKDSMKFGTSYQNPPPVPVPPATYFAPPPIICW